jgi:hypothetical protein
MERSVLQLAHNVLDGQFFDWRSADDIRDEG